MTTSSSTLTFTISLTPVLGKHKPKAYSLVAHTSTLSSLRKVLENYPDMFDTNNWVKSSTSMVLAPSKGYDHTDVLAVVMAHLIVIESPDLEFFRTAGDANLLELISTLFENSVEDLSSEMILGQLLEAIRFQGRLHLNRMLMYWPEAKEGLAHKLMKESASAISRLRFFEPNEVMTAKVLSDLIAIAEEKDNIIQGGWHLSKRVQGEIDVLHGKARELSKALNGFQVDDISGLIPEVDITVAGIQKLHEQSAKILSDTKTTEVQEAVGWMRRNCPQKE